LRPHLCLFTDSPEPSGLGEHMLMLAEELRSAYRVSLVCPPGEAGSPLLERARELGVEAVGLAVRERGPAWEELRAWLFAERVEIFHGHAGIGWEGHAGIEAARGAAVPVVVRTEHLPYLLTKPREREALAELMTQLDGLICVSEQARTSFSEAGLPPSRLRVIRNGIRPRPPRAGRAATRAALGVPAEAPLVLTVARFYPQKGHRYLLGAIPKVLRQAPRARFVWAGDGPLLASLRLAAQACGLEGRLRFLGRRDDVPDLLAAADLLVLPSLFEGLPLVALEAMAAGLAVVGTQVCGTLEAIEDGVSGRLVPPGETAALASAIVELLDQSALAARFGAAGQARCAGEFSAARMARETAQLYQELLERKRAPAEARLVELDRSAATSVQGAQTKAHQGGSREEA
jgi:glycosyltransferase involved in cell wall biosynthesis